MKTRIISFWCSKKIWGFGVFRVFQRTNNGNQTYFHYILHVFKTKNSFQKQEPINPLVFVFYVVKSLIIGLSNIGKGVIQNVIIFSPFIESKNVHMFFSKKKSSYVNRNMKQGKTRQL